jgi:magnesium transporter
MLIVHTQDCSRIELVAGKPGVTLPPGAVWLDLVEPTKEEERFVEQSIGLEVPTEADMREIEASSRLYTENDALYMTGAVLLVADRNDPANTPITFILTPNVVVTVRYATPKPFVTFSERCQRPASGPLSPGTVLVGLLETVVDRAADILEASGSDLDTVSREIFRGNAVQNGGNGKTQVEADLRDILIRIGQRGDLLSKLRDSLVGLTRIAFYLGTTPPSGISGDLEQRLKVLRADLRSLAEYETHLSSKVTFLLDATLGLISIQQNGIIKIFSVVSVVFLPPTLVASIYGMNFQHMPELAWHLGYPMALLIMVASGVLPYWFFKLRGWL